MSKFRKVNTLLLGVLLSVLLISCTTEADTETTNVTDDSDYVSNVADSTVAEYIIADDSNTQEVSLMAFTGEVVHIDNLFWTEERDRNWEIDIRSFATHVLRNHPLFDGFTRGVTNPPALPLEEAEKEARIFAFNVLLEMTAERNGILISDSYTMREELRELFIDRVNTLILDIPNIEDFEFQFRISEVATLLCDIHTNVSSSSPTASLFPVRILPLYDGVYFIGVPKEIAHSLYGRLLAINGVEINEVIDRLSKVFPYENEYFLNHFLLPQRLMDGQVLKYLDIVGSDLVADFTLMDTMGEILDVRLQALELSGDDFNNILTDDINFSSHDFSGWLTHSEEYFFYEYFSEQSIMYVRIHSFRREQFNNVDPPIINELRQTLRDWSDGETIEKLVLDLRQNAGGNFRWPTPSDFPILSEKVNYLYVIVDGGSLSASIDVASSLRHGMEHVIIIGEPAGQPESFFGGATRVFTDSGLVFAISANLLLSDGVITSSDVAFRPDILIHLTIEDVINNHDPVLAAIWAK